LASLSSEGRKRIVSPNDPTLSLEAEHWDGYSRTTFDNASETGERSATDRLIAASLEQEVASLRAISEDAPMLIWKEDATSQVVWANNAYLNLVDALVTAPSETGPS
jgi:PAS domain-containing protein